MRKIIGACVLVSAAILTSWVARGDDDNAVLQKLGQSKHSLLDGIRQTEAAEGAAISAKFEIGDDGNLSLSIYTAKSGLAVDPESNVLEELAGDPTADAWAPGIEVFADKEHIARSAGQLALMQISRLTLAQIVTRVIADVDDAGTVYSVTPKAHEGRAVAEVLVADSDGDESQSILIDLSTGNIVGR